MHRFDQILNGVNIVYGGACNKKCAYCMQEPDINNKKGDIDKFLMNFKKFLISEGITQINSVHYWGGETLLYWKQVRKTILELDSLYNIKMHRITTNGTLIDESYVEFCNKHQNVFTVVSLHDFAIPDEIWRLIGKLDRFSVTGLLVRGITSADYFKPEWERVKCLTGKAVNIGIYPAHATDGCAKDCWLTIQNIDAYFVDLIDNIYRRACNGDEFSRKIIANFLFNCSTREKLATAPKCFHSGVLSVDLFGNQLICHHNDNSANRCGNIFDRKIYFKKESDKNPERFFVSNECQSCEALPLCKGGCFLTNTHDVECYWEKARWALFKVLKNINDEV